MLKIRQGSASICHKRTTSNLALTSSKINYDEVQYYFGKHNAKYDATISVRRLKKANSSGQIYIIGSESSVPAYVATDGLDFALRLFCSGSGESVVR